MFRQSLEPEAAHALINVFPYGNTEFGFRCSASDKMQAESGPYLELPGAKLRLVRAGSHFMGSVFVMANGKLLVRPSWMLSLKPVIWDWRA